MKRTICSILASSLLFCLFACGPDTDNAAAELATQKQSLANIEAQLKRYDSFFAS